MSAIEFMPVVISSIGLAIASFMRNKSALYIAFIIWVVIFALTLL